MYIGVNAGLGDTNLSNSYNTAVGKDSLKAITTGQYNIGLGYNTGSQITTGSQNVYIGPNATASSATVSSEIIITSGIYTGKGANTAVIVSNNVYQSNNASLWSVTSDLNIKKNIEPLQSALSNILALNPVTYTYKETEKNAIGFIAQEFIKVFPEQACCCAPNEYQRDVLGLTEVQGLQIELMPHLVKAIQEQHGLIQQQTTTISALQSQLTAQQIQMDQILQRLAAANIA